MDEPVTVLIVDDQAPFRMAARAVVRRTAGFALVGEAESGERAIEQVAALQPSLVLMDIKMGGMDGIEATRHIRRAAPGTVVFLCSTYPLADLPPDATTSGAAAYINKEDLAPGVLRRLWDGRNDQAFQKASS
jgi:DNA-binding NarL/FixJ family response regulator